MSSLTTRFTFNKNCMRTSVFIFCVLLMAGPLLAQQASVGPPGFSFVAPLRIAGVYDSNFLVDRTNPNERLLVLSLPPSVQPLAPSIVPKKLDDQILWLTLPKIGFQNNSRRSDLTMTYVPDFEIYRQNGDQNSWNHDATGSFLYEVARNVQVSAGADYKSSKDPSRILQNVFLLLPRSRFEQQALRGALDVQTTPRTGFRIRYDKTRSTFGQTDPFQERLLDNKSNGLSFSLTHMLSRTQRLRFTYSYFKIEPINRARPNDDAVDVRRSFERPIRGGDVEYRVRMNPSTYLTFAGSLTNMDTGTNYGFRVMGDKRLGLMWAGAGFSRSLSYTAGEPRSFANGLQAPGFYDVLFVTLRGQLTSNTGLQFNMRAAQDSAGRLARRSRALLGSVRFDYRLTDRTVWFAGVETFQQNRNDYVRTPLARNRLTIGLEFSLSDETERRTNHLNQDEQYVALTDHIRRRQQPQ